MGNGIGSLSRSMTGPICPLHPPARAFFAQAWFITPIHSSGLYHMSPRRHTHDGWQ